jgi:hypothetical protein
MLTHGGSVARAELHSGHVRLPFRFFGAAVRCFTQTASGGGAATLSRLPVVQIGGIMATVASGENMVTARPTWIRSLGLSVYPLPDGRGSVTAGIDVRWRRAGAMR